MPTKHNISNKGNVHKNDNSIASRLLKQSYIKSKQKARHSSSDNESEYTSSSVYAEGKVESVSGTIASSGIRSYNQLGRNAAIKTYRNIKEKTDRTGKHNITCSQITDVTTSHTDLSTQNYVNQSHINFKKSKINEIVDSNKKGVKRVSDTPKSVKKAINTLKENIKRIIAALNQLITAILAGGWLAITLIIIVMLIGIICGSVFGIFFSGEDSGNGKSMQYVVREINEEYNRKIEDIRNVEDYEVIEISGQRALWKDVLSVYAVLEYSNNNEVATVDDRKAAALKDLFWDMNNISTDTDVITETVYTEELDEDGEIVVTESIVEHKYLYITVEHKTAYDMAAHYHFNEKQNLQLYELLSDKYDNLWSSVLYGINSNNIVTVALSQVGNIGGQPYWSWYGFTRRAEWCACFVSWCANECGYIENGVIPKFALTNIGVDWFKSHGQWQGKTYLPSPGDIIFFDWESDGNVNHVGIVEKCDGSVVYTIEGNSNDECKQLHYPVSSSYILGYGIPNY